MSNETIARKVAQALEQAFDIGSWDDGHVEYFAATTEQIAAVIDTALKQAPIANPGAGWSREKPTETNQIWWYKADKNDEPELIWTYLDGYGDRLMFVDSKDWPYEPQELDGYWHGPLAAPPWIEGREGEE